MLLKIGAALAAVPLAMAGVVAGTGVVVVDVKQSDGTRIVLPVPLLLAETAAHLVPANASRQAMRNLEQAQRYLPVAEEVMAAIAEAPDAELVSVDDGGEQVNIRKAGDEIHIRVTGRRERVSVNVPIDMVRKTLREVHHGNLDPEDFVGLLRQARVPTELPAGWKMEAVVGDNPAGGTADMFLEALGAALLCAGLAFMAATRARDRRAARMVARS